MVGYEKKIGNIVSELRYIAQQLKELAMEIENKKNPSNEMLEEAEICRINADYIKIAINSLGSCEWS